MNNGKLSNQMK